MWHPRQKAGVGRIEACRASLLAFGASRRSCPRFHQIPRESYFKATLHRQAYVSVDRPATLSRCLPASQLTSEPAATTIRARGPGFESPMLHLSILNSELALAGQERQATNPRSMRSKFELTPCPLGKGSAETAANSNSVERHGVAPTAVSTAVTRPRRSQEVQASPTSSVKMRLRARRSPLGAVQLRGHWHVVVDRFRQSPRPTGSGPLAPRCLSCATYDWPVRAGREVG
jgi:hypothetical protein